MADPQDFVQLLAQYSASRGARVPPDSLEDSPRFLDYVDTGGETQTKIPSARTQNFGEMNQQVKQLDAQIKSLEDEYWPLLMQKNGMTAEESQKYRRLRAIQDGLSRQREQLYQQMHQDTEKVLMPFRRSQEREQVVPDYVDILRKAIENRQQQGREPSVPMNFPGS